MIDVVTKPVSNECFGGGSGSFEACFEVYVASDVHGVFAGVDEVFVIAGGYW